MALCQNRLQEERSVTLSIRRAMFRVLTFTKQAMASRSPFRILREASANQGRCPRPQELGVRHSWKGEDDVGGRPFQADHGFPRR